MKSRAVVASKAKRRNLTYYVDPAGSNAANGRTQATAWQTVSKVNSSTFQPGDQILFKRGGVWREILTVPSSGTAAKPLVIGAYGSGSKPRLSGGAAVTGWSVSSGDVYSAPLATQPFAVVVDGVIANGLASLAALTDVTWFWQSGTLYLKRAAGSPNGVTVEATQRSNIINVILKNYVVIDGLQLDLSDNSAVSFDVTQSCEIRNCDIKWNARSGTGISTVNLSDANNAVISDNYFYHFYLAKPILSWNSRFSTIVRNTFISAKARDDQNCIHLTGDSTTFQSDGYYIAHNNYDMTGIFTPTILNDKHAFNLSDHTTGSAGARTTAGGYVGYNVGRGANGGIAIANSGTLANPIVIEHNIITDFRDAGTDFAGGVRAAANWPVNNVVVRDNIFARGPRGITLTSTSERRNWQIYNNTIYDMTHRGFEALATQGLSGEIRNNIFWVPTTVSSIYKMSAIYSGETVVSNYNDMTPSRSGVNSTFQWLATFYSSLSAFQAGGGSDANSFGSDPLFTNPALNDFSLQAGSPCIGTASDGGNIGARW